MMSRKHIAVMLLFLMSAAAVQGKAPARGSRDSLVMQRMFAYKDTMKFRVSGTDMNIYMRYGLQTVKKNVTLMTVPSMFVIARGKNNEYAGETYHRIHFDDVNQYEAVRQVSVGTVPRHKNTLPTIMEMMTPNLYDVTLMADYLLSPFNRHNRVVYRYGITFLTDHRAEIVFRPRKYNTQLVSGRAIVDEHTGRIMNVEFSGEYDMIRFTVRAEMGNLGPMSLIPKCCDVDATFNYLGNKIVSNHHTVYNMPVTLPDSIVDSHDRALMDSLRPTPLPAFEASVYHKFDSLQLLRDAGGAHSHHHNSLLKRVLWDAVGDNLVNRIKGTFGSNDQGSFRISPILNPLYLGYSRRKGLTYKMKLRGQYNFDSNHDLSLYARMGYSFKQKQFHFQLPVRYTFNKERNGYVEMEVGNGNRIFNSSIKDRMREEGQDSTVWTMENLDYFKDTYLKIRSNHDVSNRWSVGAGFTFHRRSAVDRHVFERAGRSSVYHSMAPMVETQLRPWGWRGPIITLNYEQGIKGIGKASMNYGRMEADAIWLRRFHRMRSLSMRLGAGAYTTKDKNSYFLDYENFREDNMPGGWNDDWTGEFQLLDRNLYNASEYYVRTNLTYESPLMLMSSLPLVGKIIETERFYVSSLLAKSVHPYVEWGYGFTNRLFSIGFFVATRNTKYDGVGCRLGFELFRDW